jgi:hypothetical protein
LLICVSLLALLYDVQSILDEKRTIKLGLGCRFAAVEPLTAKRATQLLELHQEVLQLQVLESLLLVFPRGDDVELLKVMSHESAFQLLNSLQIAPAWPMTALLCPSLLNCATWLLTDRLSLLI